MYLVKVCFTLNLQYKTVNRKKLIVYEVKCSFLGQRWTSEAVSAPRRLEYTILQNYKRYQYKNLNVHCNGAYCRVIARDN